MKSRNHPKLITVLAVTAGAILASTTPNARVAKSLTTTTLRKGVYAFAFGQRGLMAGLGLHNQITISA
jgi:hypothetical protein